MTWKSVTKSLALWLLAVRVAFCAGSTDAPDLVSVGNVREGDDKDTLVDFTFDEEAQIVTCCSRFQVILADGSSPLTAIDVLDKGTAGTTFTAVFEGRFAASDLSVGTVDHNVLESAGSGLLNVPQTAKVAGGNADGSIVPELESVTRDGDQLLFTFDEDIDNSSNVVANESGLKFYTKDGRTFSSSVVREGADSRTVRAIYDLPAGVTLQDAVGAFVVAGTVVGTPNSGDTNELTEVSTIQDTGAVVCGAAPEAGEQGDRQGDTEGPDLVSVGNFRRGPFTSDYRPTTCVDFVFDQAAYLNGGDMTNFALARKDGTSPLRGSSNVRAESDREGDRVVTVVMPGDIDPADFARGFVDSNTVNSDCCNAGANYPYNINQAMALDTRGTVNPDIEAVLRDGSAFIFRFDQPFNEARSAIDSAGFHVYFPQAQQQTSVVPSTPSDGFEVVNNSTVRAFFNSFPDDYTADDAVGAFVTFAAVQSADLTGGRDGKNSFDSTNKISVQDAAVCEPGSGVGGTGNKDGPTEAPDLVAVGNFREGPFTSDFRPTTCVDFTFDDVAYLKGARSNFRLVPADGTDMLTGSTNIAPSADQDPTGDNIVTVIFVGDLDPANFARGVVASGAVNAEDQAPDKEFPSNINQASVVGDSASSVNPDLISLGDFNDVQETDGQWLSFSFDQALTDDDVVQDASGLCIYFPSTSQSSVIPSICAQAAERLTKRTVRGRFTNPPEGFALTDAVGGFVRMGSVQGVMGERGGTDGMNAFDEIVKQ